ncbi:MAG: PD-(D/E)XK nuclease family protein [Acidimicrobiia bacterium]|nr:PD-(D/E)XK nuclease family protein [Acidimicrobiia bacterium]
MMPDRLSPSAAGMWAQCPQRWWYRYVEGLPEPPPGEPAVLGTFVHRVLELLLDQPPADRTEATAKALARHVWEVTERSEDWQSLELDDAAARRFRQRAWSTLLAYFSHEEPESVRPVARELLVETEVGGVPFRGFIDLVETADDDAVVVTDYKTGLPPRPGKPWSEEQRAEKLLQPQWYAAALAALGDHVPTRARLLYFTALDGQTPGSFDLRTEELVVDTSPDALEPAVDELRRRWGAIGEALQTGHVDASPGPLCGWCPYVEHCSVGQDECRQRWDARNRVTGERRLRSDAPAVRVLGLVDDAGTPGVTVADPVVGSAVPMPEPAPMGR